MPAFFSSTPFLRIGILVLSVLSAARPNGPAQGAGPLTFSVSPSGNDLAEGSLEHPFATLERARDAIRSLKKAGALPKEGATVLVGPGRHQRTTSFSLGAEDSGAPEHPIVWRAREPLRTTIDTGTRLRPDAFQRVSDSDVRQPSKEGKGHVLWADLAALGIRHKGPFPLNFDNGGDLAELYFNGERMPLSRWPNQGAAKIERIVDKAESAPGEPKRGGRFIAREERVAHWPVARGVWVEGYWRVPWDVRAVKVAAIDALTREISLAAHVGGGIGSKYAGPEGSGAEPWWAINLVEEIDQPGEWAIDFETARLYWWPPNNWQAGEMVLADLGEPVLRVDKGSDLRIEGLRVEYALSNGIELRDCIRVEVAGCRVENVSGSGVVVQRGEHNTVRSCDIAHTGQSGIVLSGGNRATLTPCGNLAENNHIHRVGVLKKTYAPGILVGIFGSGDAVGCRVAHNLIHDTSHAGVQYGGNDNIFEFNEVSHAVLTSDDMGAFYTTNDWTSCGNLLKHNFVHHSPNAVSFYMDDGDGGDTVFGNICYEMQAGPAVCGGHYNTVRNNLVVRCKRGLFLDARGVPRKYDKSSALFRKLNAVPFAQSPWSERFPYLKALPDSDTRLPVGNVVSRNVTASCEKAVRISAKPDEIQASTFDANADLQETPPGFVDEANGDLTLRHDSPVYTRLQDFEKIPFQQIGLYLDAYRKTLPQRQWSNPGAH